MATNVNYKSSKLLAVIGDEVSQGGRAIACARACHETILAPRRFCALVLKTLKGQVSVMYILSDCLEEIGTKVAV